MCAFSPQLFWPPPYWRRVAVASGALLLTIGLLAGCATNRPDLKWLYGSGELTPQPPLILIPGLMGTRLVDGRTGREKWPGGWRALVFSDYSELALPETGSDNLVPGGLTDQVVGKDFYGSILRTLTQAGGYQLTTLNGDNAGARSLYVFTYDWRRDLQQVAADLAGFVEAVKARHHAEEVDLLAHSMGGLIARYYLRFGAEDALNDNRLAPNHTGVHSVRRVILLGTPNLGTLEAIRALLKGRRVGLRRIHPATLLSMPSLYMLFPHAIVDWITTPSGRTLVRDQFDRKVWRRFQWGIYDPAVARKLGLVEPDGTRSAAWAPAEVQFRRKLERARRFVWSLTVETEESVPLIVFGGDCDYTPARLVVEEVDGTSEIRLWPGQIGNPQPGVDYRRLMLEPGDGSVSKSSLLARIAVDPVIPRHRFTHFPLAYSFLLCERHDRLPANPSFQDNLLDALLRADSPGGG